MAIDHTVLNMLLRLQDRFSLRGSILTLGVQDVMLTHEGAADVLRKAGREIAPIPLPSRKYSKSKVQMLYEGVFNVKNPMHMDDLFIMLGFSSVSSLDVFDAEQPTILHDLNNPIPDQHKAKFDVVLDIGVAEHVFDVRQFIENCIDLLRENGVLILLLPLSGWHNECFYNFQPPFFFDVFAANGFTDMEVYLNYYPKYHTFGRSKTTWLRFEYGDRVAFRKKNYGTMILFAGRKRKSGPFVIPVQTYYEQYHTQTMSDEQQPSHYMMENMPGLIRRLFPVLVPVYRNLPLSIRVPIVDGLVQLKNRSKLATRERVRL